MPWAKANREAIESQLLKAERVKLIVEMVCRVSERDRAACCVGELGMPNPKTKEKDTTKPGSKRSIVIDLPICFGAQPSISGGLQHELPPKLRKFLYYSKFECSRVTDVSSNALKKDFVRTNHLVSGYYFSVWLYDVSTICNLIRSTQESLRLVFKWFSTLQIRHLNHTSRL